MHTCHAKDLHETQTWGLNHTISPGDATLKKQECLIVISKQDPSSRLLTRKTCSSISNTELEMRTVCFRLAPASDDNLTK